MRPDCFKRLTENVLGNGRVPFVILKKSQALRTAIVGTAIRLHDLQVLAIVSQERGLLLRKS